ncbi:MAG: molybdopterin molybdenumtransferase MoeA, partial [Deltaproteobacteria bacterium]
MNHGIKLGFAEARRLCESVIKTLPAEEIALADATGRILASDVFALVDSPSIDGSAKDGFAVISSDIAHAAFDNPVSLELSGTIYAGDTADLTVVSGTAARILTGAELPQGANAVVAEEFTRIEEGRILVTAHAEPGRNVIPCGSDIRQGEPVARQGEKVSPGCIGLAAAAGCSSLPVIRRPRVGLMATGDEVVAPG